MIFVLYFQCKSQIGSVRNFTHSRELVDTHYSENPNSAINGHFSAGTDSKISDKSCQNVINCSIVKS